MKTKSRKSIKSGDITELRSMVELLTSQNAKLSSLLNISREIMKEVKLTRLFRLLMKKVTEVMNAERSSLFLLDDRTDELYALVAQRASTYSIRFPVGTGIAGHVAQTGEVINLQDAYRDSRFNKEFDRKTGFRTRSMLCMPIRNTRGKLIGVTQVLNKKGDLGYFTQDDENLLVAFSSIAAISLENSLAYETINYNMAIFEKFVPRRYLESIARGGMESIMVGNAEEVKVTILFSDIRNFTSLSEGMDADETLIFLNDFLRRMSREIARRSGFIDKFIGDAIMAVFDSQRSDIALEAGIGMLKALQRFNRERMRKGLEPIRIGLGLHYGGAVLGTVGSEDRMDSTIIGDSVNLASRTEGLTKYYGTPFLITEDLYSNLEDPSSFMIRPVDTVRVKGRDRPIRIYEVFDADPAVLRRKKVVTADLLERGIEEYQSGNWMRAVDIFLEGERVFKNDPLFRIYREKCEVLLKRSDAENEGWDGTTRFEEK